ncbi:hypothetical protein [Chromatium okenii]|nr:hypothetical protein [Chromatium okenii]
MTNYKSPPRCRTCATVQQRPVNRTTLGINVQHYFIAIAILIALGVTS